MRKSVKLALTGLAASTLLMGPGALTSAAAQDDPVVPRHARNVCQSATVYKGYDSARGPYEPQVTIYYWDKVGHTPGKHPVHNGWASAFIFGASGYNDWGVMRFECIGAWDSW